MKKSIKIWLFIFLLVSFFASPSFANNLVISNATIEDRDAAGGTAVVQFNISWDHSWRKNDGRKDAAWVFLKIYKNTTAPWIHGKLKTAGTNPVDTSSGSNNDTEIIIPSDKIGAFIQRRATGNGTFSSSKVRLTIDLTSSGVSSTDTIQVKLFGIEMVYSPTGPFYIGDGNGQNESPYAFHQNGVDNTAVQITTASTTITVDANGSDDIDSSPVAVTGGSGITGNTSWPNGYSAFYLMKYETTQGQYRDFLNTLSRKQQNNHVSSDITGDAIVGAYTFVMEGDAVATYRNGIRAPASGNGTTNPITFGCDLNSNLTYNESVDGEYSAVNKVYWSDLAAYADWAGLRPMTEMEYEKAARGSNTTVYGEYAWGNTKKTNASSTLTNSGMFNEIPANIGPGLVNVDNLKPYRSGFAATNSTNREGAAAGYYGNMDLTGNLVELAVCLGGVGSGRSFQGTHGDGTLTTTTSYEGNATNNDWPGIDATTARGVTKGTPSGTGYRGGSAWGIYLTLSDRTGSCIADAYGREYFGFRLARTAP